MWQCNRIKQLMLVQSLTSSGYWLKFLKVKEKKKKSIKYQDELHIPSGIAFHYEDLEWTRGQKNPRCICFTSSSWKSFAITWESYSGPLVTCMRLKLHIHVNKSQRQTDRNGEFWSMRRSADRQLMTEKIQAYSSFLCLVSEKRIMSRGQSYQSFCFDATFQDVSLARS